MRNESDDRELIAFGRRLRRLRRLRRMSQQELGVAVGVWQSHISAWEIGKAGLTVCSFVRLARALGVTLDELWMPTPPREQAGDLPLKIADTGT